jgi:hypothetical protein
MKLTALCAILLGVGIWTGTTAVQTLSQSKPTKPKTVLKGSSDPDRADWQPNAKVNPNRPVQVVFINEFGEAFNYTLMGHTDARGLAPGKTAKLGKVPLPAYIAINPQRNRINIRYKVSVSNNIVTLKIKPAKGQGQRALEIDNKGDIYAY